MTDVATWIERRLAADRDLGLAALAKLAADIGADDSLWRQYVRHDAKERVYQQLYRDPNIDVWLICWMHRQDTGYHDHDRSSGAVHVCEGTLWEDYFLRCEDGWIREQTRRHDAGSTFDFAATYIHGVRNEGDVPATSVHVYSPALWRMGHYEPDPAGIMQRVSMTYADELLGAA
jgi:Cysteine dioxygenase type I